MNYVVQGADLQLQLLSKKYLSKADVIYFLFSSKVYELMFSYSTYIFILQFLLTQYQENIVLFLPYKSS